MGNIMRTIMGKNNECLIEDNNESKKVKDDDEGQRTEGNNEELRMTDNEDEKMEDDNESQEMDNDFDIEIEQITEELYDVVWVEMYNFSNEEVHVAGEQSELIKIFTNREITVVDRVPKFYANGSNDDNKGYVSILLEKPGDLFDFDNRYYFEIIFIISVLDVEGKKRFTQSFSLGRELSRTIPISEAGFNKYISRETVLNQASELLKDDILALYIEIKKQRRYDYTYPDTEVEEYLESCLKFDDSVYKLSLDSALGKRLSEESIYFQRMLSIPMMEKDTKTMKICESEYSGFQNIGRIMMGTQYIEAFNIDDICSLYVIANKYDIPVVIDICRHLLEKRICDGNVELILELVHTLNDDYLKEVVERFQSDSNYRIKQNEINSKWAIESFQYEPLCFSDYEQIPKFDFYR